MQRKVTPAKFSFCWGLSHFYVAQKPTECQVTSRPNLLILFNAKYRITYAYRVVADLLISPRHFHQTTSNVMAGWHNRILRCFLRFCDEQQPIAPQTFYNG